MAITRYYIHSEKESPSPKQTQTEKPKQADDFLNDDQIDEFVAKFEFLQTSVNMMCNEREIAGLPANVGYRMGYCVLLLYLFKEAQFFTDAERNRAFAIFTFSVSRAVGENVYDSMQHFNQQLDMLRRNGTERFINVYLLGIEAQLCDESLKDDEEYMARCLRTVLDSLKFILEALP